ncbi:putative lipid phosphatase CDC1 [Sugiyamaella lignohabitans]|uniref:Putative lipid phosphatase CDC1 n=1 Tax=Sugiyamaella lignohabitans TaxID=796027 RepID=A0A167FM95_9ASCO|nr:putative lipid phosphatase CDC1 [Sugiyamaella lignohabitans]ANB15473.1 putative lipid phosphatase CDC1 [Sugiyamaella lignohabitans]
MSSLKSAYRRGGNPYLDTVDTTEDIDLAADSGTGSQFLPRRNKTVKARIQALIRGIYYLDPDMIRDQARVTSLWAKGTYQSNLTKPTYLHALLLSWVLLLWYGERHYPYSAIKSKCHWHAHTSGSHPSRVALIADPQLIDDNTYPTRPKTLLAITKYIVDSYLRRNWVNINKILDPHANIFLGDLFDGGREWSDSVWREEYDRWNRIFTRPPYKRTVMSLPGNHDIGYGDTLVPHALNRFQAYFGETSSTVDVGEYTFVLLDTISMLNTVNSSIYGPPTEFLKNLDKNLPADKPRILLTHIPLYRSPDSKCGKHRESSKGALPYVYGYQYQTLVTPKVSNDVLTAVKPIAVFSGDDHDACHVQHKFYDARYDPQNPSYNHKLATWYPAEPTEEGSTLDAAAGSRIVDEYTVKSISMAMGIDYPGIQLVTLGPTGYESDPSHFHTSICLMPSPFWAFTLYGLFAIITLGVVLLYNLFPARIPRRFMFLNKAASSSVLDVSLPTHSGEEKPRLPINRPLRKSWSSLAFDLILTAGLVISLFLYLNRALFD